MSEAQIPTNELLTETRLGRVARPGDDDQIVSLLLEEVESPSEHRSNAMKIMAERHSWDQRAAQYDAFFRFEFGIECR